ncbi:hypothetical protein DNTS_023679 [Danionella cerebrum]|nr:hypothetical protein DNTS_023679 [Danionella translucida]TRY54398.1 hypothetical protein DNTS_023679 [Danionella translucida]
MGLILSWLRGPREPVDLLDVSVETQVTSSADPVTLPPESETQYEDTASVATETHVEAPAVETSEMKSELPAENPVLDVPVPEVVEKLETTATVETVTEAPDAVLEVDVHVVEAVEEPVVEPEAINIEPEPTEVHNYTEVTECLQTQQDVHSEPEPEEFPEEAAVSTEALVEPELEEPEKPIAPEEPMGFQMLKPLVESTSDPITEETLETESIVVAGTMVAEEQVAEIRDAPELLPEASSVPEPLPVAKEIIQDLAVSSSRNVDGINGCLGVTEVATES